MFLVLTFVALICTFLLFGLALAHLGSLVLWRTGVIRILQLLLHLRILMCCLVLCCLLLAFLYLLYLIGDSNEPFADCQLLC